MKKTFTLKHIIIAFTVGALLMTSGQVLADTISQIGNKVAGESAVYVNGKRVSDAVIIKNKSYVPARDVAEELGANVEWKGAEGIMITQEYKTDYEIVSFDNEEDVAAHNAKVRAYNSKKAELSAAIQTSKMIIDRLQGFIDKYNEDNLEGYSKHLQDFYLQEVERSKSELEEEQAKLAQYEKELQELESTQ